DDPARVVVGGAVSRGQAERRVERRLVGIVDPGELLELAAPSPGVESLRVALLAHLERRVDERLDERRLADHLAHELARGPIRTHGGAHGYAAVADDLCGYEPDPQDVGVPVLSAEPKALREVGPDDVAIEHGDPAASLHQQHDEYVRDRGLPGTRESG